MKFLKLRYILPTIIAIILLVVAGLYFIGGLKAHSIKTTNLTFNPDSFEELHQDSLGREYKVAQNDKYTMFIDEITTIVKVVENSTCTNVNDSTTCSAVYSSAKAVSDYSDEKSNLIVRYFDENGRANTTGFNTFEYSVAYFDKLQGITVPHYKLNYIENGVDILYEVGNFTNIKSFFPSNFQRLDFDDLFRGNLQLYTKTGVLAGLYEGKNVLQYTGFGATYSEECAAYLAENELATVTPAKDTYGNLLGRWDLKEMQVSDGRIGLKAGVDFNTETSPCTSNPFTNSSVISSIYSPQSYSLSQSGDVADMVYITDTTQYVENSSYTLRFNYNISTTLYKKLYAYMYDTTKVGTTDEGIPYGNYLVASNKPVYYDYDGDGEVSGEELVQVGGYQARDEEGLWLYDDDGKPVQTGFTEQLAQDQNVIFGNDSDAQSTAFQVCLRFELTAEGLKAVVINDSIIEGREPQYVGDLYGHTCKIYEIQVVPYLTTNQDVNSKGQIILPDGSGAIISFNSVKDAQNAKTYSKEIYGGDATLPRKDRGSDVEDIMLGMYGFLDFTQKKGVVAIVDSGAAQTSIQADFMRAAQTTTFNYARFTTTYRVKETVTVNAASSFSKWSIDLYGNDVIYKYHFLSADELDYVNVAQKYREYLIEKYDLKEDGDKTKEHVATLNFLGAFEKKKLTLGLVHNADYSLTTFKQALEIVSDLNLSGVKNFNIAYTSWTSDDMNVKADNYVKPARILGGQKDFYELRDYLQEKSFGFYPQISVTNNRGYDYAYGELKYSPKSVGSTYSLVSDFVLATGLADKTRRAGSMVSPRFYNSLVNNYLQSYSRFDIDGVLAQDLGNQRIGDYAKKVQIYNEDGSLYQQDALAIIQAKVGNVMLDAPYDYAFKYVTSAVNVPLKTTLYPSVDYSIPLYQLVVSGLFDYTGDTVNLNNEYAPNWYLLKALETGSNLAFVVSAEDTKILLETPYTEYYNAYFINWKQKIIDLNKELNKSGIYESRLVSHQYLTDNVVMVGYENGLKLIINFDNKNYQDPLTGLAIRGNWYMVVEEGN